MEFIIKVRVTVPDLMELKERTQIEDSINWQKLRFLDNLRRSMPHSVKVDDAGLPSVES